MCPVVFNKMFHAALFLKSNMGNNNNNNYYIYRARRNMLISFTSKLYFYM
jgi:hypothetical protein